MNAKACATSDIVAAWNQIDWQKAENYVKKKEIEIYRLSSDERSQLLAFLDYLHSATREIEDMLFVQR